jgi:hypothetical protein
LEKKRSIQERTNEREGKMRFIKYVMLGVVALMAGCASTPMEKLTAAPPKPAADQAQVVFMRDSFLGQAIQASVFDVTTPSTQFIGVVTNKTKVAYATTAGKHTFMVVSEAADFLEADLTAGKTYYAMVIPRMGAWKARFSLWPVAKDPSAKYSLQSKDFPSWLADTTWVANSPASKAWYEANKASVESKQKEYWAVWQKKSPEDIKERTLQPGDGQVM